MVHKNPAASTAEASAPPASPVSPPVIPQKKQKDEKAIEEEKKKSIEEEKAQITQEAERKLRSKKARVEFRDAYGNVLDENLVASLRREGKLHLETRYEARSRLDQGHEVDVVDGKIDPFADTKKTQIA